MSSARGIAGKILAKGSLAVKFAKAVINSHAETDLQMGLVIERLAQAILFSTDDRTERINAFLEKRSSNFSLNSDLTSLCHL